MSWPQILMPICIFLALVCLIVGTWPSKPFPKRGTPIKRIGKWRDG